MRQERASRSPAPHGVDVAYGVLLSAAFLYGLWTTRHYFFWLDSWLLLHQSGSLGGLVDEYNGHLSIVILVIYRVLIEVFGFHHAPFQLVGMLCLFAVPVSYYLTTRRQLGPTVAAVLGLSFLASEAILFVPVELNHFLALVGGIICAGALNRGRRADPWLAAALAFSLASAGGGIAVAVACVVHNLCVRPSLRRWIAVLGPSALWGCWWLAVGRDYSTEFETTPAQAVHIVRELAGAAFASLGLHSSVLGSVLMVAFIAYGLWLLRHGLDAAANWLAWTAALVLWGMGLAYSRGYLTDPHTFRYQLPAIGFVLLAVVPRRHVEWSVWFPRGADRRWAVALTAVVLIGAMRAPGLERDLSESSQRISRASTLNRGRIVVLSLEPKVVPDDTRYSLGMGGLRAGEVRSLLDRYGFVPPAGPDQALVEMGVVQSSSDGGRSDVGCEPLTAPISQSATTAGHPLFLWAPDTAVEVDVRRFGVEWVRLDEARPGEALMIFLPGLDSETPWEVRADGACIVGARIG